jgi:hypothetical protein
MANKRQGYEGIAYFGAAGAQASSQLLNVRDIDYQLTHNRGRTTVRGDSTAPPIDTESVTVRIAAIEVTVVFDSTDASVLAMIQHAANGTAFALRTKSYASGLGYDGDVTAECGRPFPLDSEQLITFNCRPTLDGARTPLLNS